MYAAATQEDRMENPQHISGLPGWRIFIYSHSGADNAGWKDEKEGLWDDDGLDLGGERTIKSENISLFDFFNREGAKLEIMKLIRI